MDAASGPRKGRVARGREALSIGTTQGRSNRRIRAARTADREETTITEP